jgi:hypothetical protein
MRAREMMAKLDRFPQKRGRQRAWDLSLLSPEKQDRVHELLRVILGSKDIYSKSLDTVFAELVDLVGDLPDIGIDEREQGPLIEVPRELASYCYWHWQQKASEWRHYSFSSLGKVQTLRFVELCKRYGYEAGPEQMTPLAQWRTDDRVEMTELLDAAATQRLRWY